MSAASPRAIGVAVGAVYLLAYLFVLGDLSLSSVGGWQATVASQWSELWLRPRGLFQFEGIAMVQAGRLHWIVSPLNLAIAGTMAALVAANVHGALAMRRQPAQCRPAGASGGALAAVPALLAGGACCAPALIILLGLPGLGAFAGLFGWLVPLAIGLLVLSRWWQRRLGAPPFRGAAA